MVIVFVFAVCLFGNSFGENSFKVRDDARKAFDGFDLAGNIALKEKREFETEDYYGYALGSEDEYLCECQDSGVDVDTLFRYLAASGEAWNFTYPHYMDFLKDFDTNENGRVSAYEFFKHWNSMIVGNGILLQDTTKDPDIETLQRSTVNPLT